MEANQQIAMESGANVGTSLRRIMVTGANKGVGLAAVKRCLYEHDDTHCIMACRSIARGNEAMAKLVAKHPAWKDRLSVLEMDVGSDTSVEAAAATLIARHGASPPPLHAYVNNAGIASGTLAEIFNVNVRGPHRVDTRFIPLLDQTEGRVVLISSGLAGMCVSKCSDERKIFLSEPNGQEWAALEALMAEILAYPKEAKDLTRHGFGSSGYALSKALLNSYMLALARQHPQLKINAASPGLVATDVFGDKMKKIFGTRAAGRFVARNMIGALTPHEAAFSTVHLLFDELGPVPSGRYYGSDAKCSTMDEYGKHDRKADMRWKSNAARAQGGKAL